MRQSPQHGDPPDLAPATTRDIRYGAAVYGSFLVASVVGAAFEAGADARTLTGSAFVSMLIFWLAHVWSEVVGHHVAEGSRFNPRVIPVIARREWPLVEAAVVPTVLLALAWAGVWSREAGATLALGQRDSADHRLGVRGRASLRRFAAQRRRSRRGAGDAWCRPARPRASHSLIEPRRRSHTDHVMTAHLLDSETGAHAVD